MKAWTNAIHSNAYTRSQEELQERQLRPCLMFHSPSADTFALWMCDCTNSTGGKEERRMGRQNGGKDKKGRDLAEEERGGSGSGRKGTDRQKTAENRGNVVKGRDRDSDRQIKKRLRKMNSGMPQLC